MIENISLDYLKIFYEVAKCENITKAGEKLFISQPAISQTLNKLELELNAKLLIRTNKGIKLTEIGKKVFEKVENLMTELNQIKAIVESENDLTQGKLYIGSARTILKTKFFNSVVEFNRQFPNIEISFFDETHEFYLDGILNGSLDLCVVQTKIENKNLSFEKFFEDEYIFVKSNGYKLKSEIEDNKFILQSPKSFNRSLFNEFCEREQIKCTKILGVVGYDTAINLCEQGAGVALVRKYSVQNELESGEFEKVFPQFAGGKTVHYLCINNNNKTKALMQFLKILKEKETN